MIISNVEQAILVIGIGTVLLCLLAHYLTSTR